MKEIFLLLGSNLGDPKEYLNQAVNMIRKQIASPVKLSSIYKTAAWGKSDQPDFYNQVVHLESGMEASNLLSCIHKIENELGRLRNEHWGSRTIDIDILFFGQEILNTQDLVIPHKLLHKRKFALIPLSEIAADLFHPVLKKTVKQLLLELDDNLSVEKLKNNI